MDQWYYNPYPWVDLYYSRLQRQSAVTAHLKSKQLLLFAFERKHTWTVVFIWTMSSHRIPCYCCLARTIDECYNVFANELGHQVTVGRIENFRNSLHPLRCSSSGPNNNDDTAVTSQSRHVGLWVVRAFNSCRT